MTVPWQVISGMWTASAYKLVVFQYEERLEMDSRKKKQKQRSAGIFGKEKRPSYKTLAIA